ncbi:hypothetical protein BaRGS_00040029 [Batillaria attramentaria]|uniref:Ig-like domain-containing protein n=1 Tax=Batillaria attramentaria TaxID=370345 RepID=A0ABD0J1L9_9CAEN
MLSVVLLGAASLISTTQGVKSNCNATANGSSASVTCHFSEDVSKSRSDVSVDKYKLNSSSPYSDQVLACLWLKDDKPTCRWLKGYALNEDFSDTLTIQIPELTKQFEGRYRCQATPSEVQDNTDCILERKGPTTTTSVTISTYQPNNQTARRKSCARES